MYVSFFICLVCITINTLSTHDMTQPKQPMGVDRVLSCVSLLCVSFVPACSIRCITDVFLRMCRRVYYSDWMRFTIQYVVFFGYYSVWWVLSVRISFGLVVLSVMMFLFVLLSVRSISHIISFVVVGVDVYANFGGSIGGVPFIFGSDQTYCMCLVTVNVNAGGRIYTVCYNRI